MFQTVVSELVGFVLVVGAAAMSPEKVTVEVDLARAKASEACY